MCVHRTSESRSCVGHRMQPSTDSHTKTHIERTPLHGCGTPPWENNSETTELDRNNTSYCFDKGTVCAHTEKMRAAALSARSAADGLHAWTTRRVPTGAVQQSTSPKYHPQPQTTEATSGTTQTWNRQIPRLRRLRKQHLESCVQGCGGGGGVGWGGQAAEQNLISAPVRWAAGHRVGCGGGLHGGALIGQWGVVVNCTPDRGWQ